MKKYTLEIRRGIIKYIKQGGLPIPADEVQFPFTAFIGDELNATAVLMARNEEDAKSKLPGILETLEAMNKARNIESS